MTHAQLRQRLRAYADGTLGDADAEVVRIHLAGGCEECLREVFTRPVGLPRPAVVMRRRPRGTVVAAVAAAAVIGVGVGALLGGRDAPRTRGDARIDALAAEVARLRDERQQADAAWRRRLDELEGRAAATQPASAGSADADRPPSDPVASPTASPPSEPRPAPPREAAAAAPPAPPGPGTPPDSGGAAEASAASETTRPVDGAASLGDADVGVPGWVTAVLASEGARVVPLGPGDQSVGGTGFAVWSRSRRTVIVSASNLPVAETSVSYRVRVTMADGSTAWVGDVVASPRRDLAISVALPDTRTRVDRVDLYRDPPGTPVLTARLTP